MQQLAEGARAIGEGKFDVRLEPETSDELGSLIEAFNMMAAELRTSRERLDQSRLALERKNIEVDARRRYIETILERVATGVISLDASGRISTMNGAAERLLGLDDASVGQPARDVFDRSDLRPLLPLVDATERSEPRGVVQEITLAREGREIHLATAATVLTGDDGQSEGAVLVLDDVTPLIRAQRVAAWRDVARRLAHEIKNPLTPDPAERRADAPAFLRGAAADAGARRGVHRRDHHRSRGAERARGRIRAVRADARPANGADRSSTASSTTRCSCMAACCSRARCASSGNWPPSCRLCGSTPNRFGR